MAATITPWHHDALAIDLARHLMKDGKVWVWLNSTIGAWSGPRPDAMAYRRYSYDQPTIQAFEIKVSRSDLLADLNKGKWRAYLEHCQSVTFVMPSGLCTKDEIPAECGVMFRTNRGWRTERRATTIGSGCSMQAMAKLLTVHPLRLADKDDRTLPEWRREAWGRTAGDSFMAQAGARYGRELAALARQRADGKDIVALTQQRADEIMERARALSGEFRALLRPMLDLLGLKPDADEYAIRQAVRERVRDLQADTRVAHVEQALEHARASLARVRPLEESNGRPADPATNHLFR